jgi:serine/threonine-protein kinase
VRDSDVAKMYAHLSAPPPAVTLGAPDVPRAFDAVIQRAMAKDPADRYPSAGDMGRAAVAAATGAAATGAALAGPERSVARGAAAAVALGAAAAQNAEATEVSPGPTRVAGGRAHAREAERATPAPIPVLKPRNGRTAAIAAGVLVAGLATSAQRSPSRESSAKRSRGAERRPRSAV